MNKKFNKNQKKAVEFYKGPCLVLAGPGSGKTYVLTNRIYNLINTRGVDSKNILSISFTRSAADEIKNRFREILDVEEVESNVMPTFGTFHSVFFEILRESFGYTSKSLIDVVEEREILRSAIWKVQGTYVSDAMISLILKDIKEYKLSLEKVNVFEPKYLNKKLFFEIYDKYQENLFYEKKLDFSDMIWKCYRLLKDNKEILKYYQDKYKYILIDEFQDINKLQYMLIKLLCKSKNLFVVGDDDQSIYQFRGSSPNAMIDFIKDYKNVEVINLNENYRCARKIVEFSKRVIAFNKNRFNKDLISNRELFGVLEIKAFVDSRQQNEYIVNIIKKYKKQGIPYSGMAILYRTNILANSIIPYLDKYNIAFNKNEKDIENESDVKKDVKKENKKEIKKVDAVSLMTFHMSKGLEFNVIIIVDANDGLVPHKKSIKEHEIEAERRLFYVAMTRAKDNLHIFFTVNRFGKSYNASRFILEAIGDEDGKER